MQMDDAEKLRAAWGGKPCSHPRFSKEYMRGMQTGDYICDQCGMSFSRDEVAAIEAQRSTAG
jgi:hypothetical protein